MSLTRVTDGEIATIVTSLQMLERPKPRPMAPSNLRLDRWREPAPDRYRTLFRRIGEPWLWFSRLVMDEAALLKIIHDPTVEIYAVTDRQGIEIGLLELDFREAGQAELSFFGLVPELTGKGEGRWLMGQALALCWRKGIERVWVHTCTLDHPKALNFYRAQGFVPYARAIETFPDPRVIGILPPEAAPQVPLLKPASLR
ncbi:GNAT family N-acetyltransferase [Sphingomonas sp. CGMCC 1.13654]|uniref:GNAT family N-acetyltransferase n=1 Tax=Sphingomonas chungangi TaxID=2683589 RepID=A0A838LAG1_9SPHN|nr:GNAT family N-acetyltransferase [Sphingomonas chungangi]MBA2935870.1 GNAT family N-acetyltransferase [Sphingomonas chungangi]MVW54561.1 GNAT family N-acetyltransferase [Sphingomonas chungangi]